MKRALLMTTLMAAMVLAGCSGDPTEPGDEPGDGGDADATVVDVPTWAPGDWWTYDTNRGTSVTLVVTAAAGTAYTVDAADMDTAFFEVYVDDLSYVGAIRTTDLAGQEGSNWVRYADFPLEHNKEWRTDLEGESYDVVAHDRGDGTFHIQFQQDAAIIHEFVYDPVVKWFRSWSWDSGGNSFSMTLRDHGQGRTQPAVRVEVSDVFSSNATFPHVPEPFTVPMDVTDLWVHYALSCPGTGLAVVLLGNQDSASTENGIAIQETCPTQAAGVRVMVPDQAQWALITALPDAPPAAYFDVTMIARTAVEVPIA